MTPKRSTLDSLARKAEPAATKATKKATPPAAKATNAPKAKDAEGQMFNVRLDLPMWKDLKLASMNLRRPAADLVRDAIRAHLKALGGARG